MKKTNSVHKAAPVVLGLLLVAGCATRRESVALEETVVAGGLQAEPLETVLAEVPGYVTREREKALSIALRDAETLVSRAYDLELDGRVDESRWYCLEALSLLEVSGLSVDQRAAEPIHYEIESLLRRQEVLASLVYDEPPFPAEEVTDSPLDTIAKLDLYTVEVDPKLEHLVSEDLKETPFDFPITINREVLGFLDYYQGRGREAMEEAMRRSGRYLSTFRRIFAEQGVPQDLVYMAHVESLFKPKAYSRARARGIWQFVAGTARLYDLQVNWWLDERLDVYKATHSAARHLLDLKNEFGDWYLALAAYNGGPGRVRRVLRRHGDLDYWTMAKRRLLPRETRNYVPSILAAMIIYRKPERYGFHVVPEPNLRFDEVPVEFQFDLRVAAEEIGVEVDQLEDLNLELLRGVTPFEPRGYSLKVPSGRGELAAQRLAQLPAEKRLKWAHHKVRGGETLSLIAGRYGVTVRAIAEMNRIRNIHRLSLGQDLLIPLSEWRAVSAGSIRGGEMGEVGSGSHTVRSGESLYRIARHYGLRLDDLLRWNNLNSTDVIYPGQEIRLSDGQALLGGQ